MEEKEYIVIGDDLGVMNCWTVGVDTEATRGGRGTSPYEFKETLELLCQSHMMEELNTALKETNDITCTQTEALKVIKEKSEVLYDTYDEFLNSIEKMKIASELYLEENRARNLKTKRKSPKNWEKKYFYE